uniref:Annexin A7 (Trinotate prediction) n=1 Tax=Henneguya salminicola TaxID=69463 RepID=A0A6G3MFZ6_HENSL
MSKNNQNPQQPPPYLPPQGYYSGQYPPYPSQTYPQAGVPVYSNPFPGNPQYSHQPPLNYPPQYYPNVNPPFPPGQAGTPYPVFEYSVQHTHMKCQPQTAPQSYPAQPYSQQGGPFVPCSIFPMSTITSHGAQGHGYKQEKRNKFIYIGPSMPSIRPVLTCNVSADAENLFKAFKGIGCDNKVVINVLTRRSSADRQKIVQEYSRRYGKSLIDRTVSEIYEPLERVLVSILYIGPDLDAYLLRKATKKLGTNETCLINILVTRSSFQITQIKESYTRLHNGKSLEKHIASDTSGNFQKILLFLLNVNL